MNFFLSLVSSHQQGQTSSEPYIKTYLPKPDTSVSFSNDFEVLAFYFVVGELFKDGAKYFATNVCSWMNEWVKEVNESLLQNSWNNIQRLTSKWWLCHVPVFPKEKGTSLFPEFWHTRSPWDRCSWQTCKIDICFSTLQTSKLELTVRATCPLTGVKKQVSMGLKVGLSSSPYLVGATLF